MRKRGGRVSAKHRGRVVMICVGRSVATMKGALPYVSAVSSHKIKSGEDGDSCLENTFRSRKINEAVVAKQF